MTEIDRFVAERLPPRTLWPTMDTAVPPLVNYPLELNLCEPLLDRWLDEPERPAIYFEDEVWSYGRLAETSNRLARLLRDEHGVRPGSRVLLRSANNPWLVASIFAIWRLGAIAVPTMPNLRRGELEFIISRARIEFVITRDSLAAEVEGLVAPGGLIEIGGPRDVADRVGAHSAEPFRYPTSRDDCALIAFTSGTTGRPKATLHFHRDPLAVADTFAAELIAPRRDDVFCGSPQIAFLYGLCAFIADSMRYGAASVLAERASPEDLIGLIRRHRATVCFTTPSALPRMLEAVPEDGLGTLRLMVVGGEPLPGVVHDGWIERTGVPIVNGLGVSEILHMFIASRPGQYRPGFIGPAVTGYDVRIGDEQGNPVARGEPGYLFVRGPTGCRYLDDEARQEAYVYDGWNRTGDICMMDEDGFVAFIARSDDMIVTSGFNVSPLEVEEVLLKHPGIRECAVIGTPDPDRTALVTAYVVRQPDAAGLSEKDVIEYCRANLATFKCPRLVHFVDALPRTNNDKIQRSALRVSPAAV